MDAPNVVSLSAAIGQAVPDALLEEMRLRELDRMRWVDLESRLAQTHFASNLQTHPNAGLVTWQTAHRRLWNLVADMNQAINEALAHLFAGRIAPAEDALFQVRGDNSEDEVFVGSPAGSVDESEEGADREDGDNV